MFSAPTVEDVRQVLERELNGPIKYFDIDKLVIEDMEIGDLLIGISLELQRSVSEVCGTFKLTPKRLFLRCSKIHFDVHKMICDHYCVGHAYEDLRRLHGIGNSTISRILNEAKIPRSKRNELRDVTDEAVWEEFQSNGRNITATAKCLGLSRSTIYKKINCYHSNR